ncbi:hypothetical protein QBC47DRAFT_439789 [Echria macrotheca]|uniref:Glucose oxidase n=1 Tax=Echria macrotheca TaxID=438768 RepID=A0AAJ0F3V7_9PEZI|nr:hypothetical protein QBC47DRAFT_439789 [Echria macrotheca]
MDIALASGRLNVALLLVFVLNVFFCPSECLTVTNDTTVADGKSFDYVIVGAGLSGLTVGNKLSNKGFSVLIIEAGAEESRNSEVYDAEGRKFGSNVCNWHYPAYDEQGQPLSWKIDSGACIGGGTSINGMVWYRPTEAEIDKLETFGNPGWNWRNLLPYMFASERNIPPDETQRAQGAGLDPAVHGFKGFINTSFPTPLRIPGAVALYKKALPLTFPGLSVGDDLSDRPLVSSATTLYTIWYDKSAKINRRSSAADGLLWAPSNQHLNLTVLTTHKVDKVIFGPNFRATGVSFVSADTNSTATTEFQVFAAKRVILSAGSLASGSILERSGIGRRDILEKAGIKLMVDLPGVGANLNDQPGTESAALLLDKYVNDTSIVDNRSLFAPEISVINGDELWGALSASHMSELVSKDALRSRAKSLVEAHAAATVAGAEAILNATIDLIANHKLPVVEFLAESAGNTLYTAFWPLQPLSRGHVHINSSNPLENPVIVPRLLVDTFDQAVAVSVARASRALFASPPFSQVVADPYYSPPIGPNGTDAEYLAWYKNTSFGASHWMGSTAMMPRHLGGVVDHKLQVYGTRNLHVVDAGILPIQLTSHMMSTLYAVASRAADIILTM